MSRKTSQYQSALGFTLVELLVALFVFSLLSAFAYRAINTLVKTGDAVEMEMTALANVQRAVLSMERDLRQKTVPVLAVTDAEAVSLTPDKTQLDITVLAKSAATTKATIKHMRYSLKGKVLVRESWNNNKPTSEQPDDSAILLKNVASVEFTALDQTAATTSNSWPAYFQIALEHEELGSIKRSVYFGIKEPDLKFSSLTGGGGNNNQDPDRNLCQDSISRDC